jgi:hypothetical protein
MPEVHPVNGYPDPDDPYRDDSEMQLQGESVEMVFVQKGQPIEFYDLAGTKGRPLERNPDMCIGCHSAGNPDGYTEPHFIFHNTPVWPNFVGGAQACDPTQDQLFSRAAERAVEAARGNPRFRCVEFSNFQPSAAEHTGLVERRVEAFKVLSGNDNVMYRLNEE